MKSLMKMRLALSKGSRVALATLVSLMILPGCERQTSSLSEANTPQPNAVDPTPVRRAGASTSSPPATVSPQLAGAQDEGTVRARLKNELGELTERIRELRERVGQVHTTTTRERIAAAVTDLEKKRRAIADQLDHWDDWQTSASLAWSDMREGLERALRELRDAYEKAKSHF